MNTRVKKSKATRRKQQFASNRQYTQKAAFLTDFQYNEMQLELGLAFLTLEFPPNPLQKSTNELYELHKVNRAFWQWWMSEWSAYESKLVELQKENFIHWTPRAWKEYLARIVNDDHVHHSFYHNYLRRTPVWNRIKT